MGGPYRAKLWLHSFGDTFKSYDLSQETAD